MQTCVGGREADAFASLLLGYHGPATRSSKCTLVRFFNIRQSLSILRVSAYFHGSLVVNVYISKNVLLYRNFSTYDGSNGVCERRQKSHSPCNSPQYREERRISVSVLVKYAYLLHLALRSKNVREPERKK